MLHMVFVAIGALLVHRPNVKLKRALGWEKMPVTARAGLTKTLESFGIK